MCFICKLLFSVLSLLASCKSSEKSAKTIRTIGKTPIPFNFSFVLFLSSELVNFLYFYPPCHPYHFTGNQPTPKPTTFPGPSPTHLPRGLWERLCPKLPEVLRYTYFKLKFQFTFHLLKKIIELTSYSTPLLSVAANIIITLSSSSSPSNITKVVMSTIIPVLLVTEPHQTSASFL